MTYMKKLENLREVLKTVKHRKPTGIFCPRCTSSRIGLFSSLDIWLTPKKYVCEDCGYIGPVVMELEETEKEKGSD